MKLKKALFTLGTIAIATSPILGVVSCGTSVASIDLSQINSVKDLLNKINNYIHTTMPESGAKLGNPQIADPSKPVLNADQIKDITKYMQGIQDSKINITYKGKSITLNFQLRTFTSKIINSLSNMPDAAQQQKNVTLRISQIFTGKLAPNITAYVGKSAPGMGGEMSGFMALDDSGWNAYNDELNSFTSVFWNLSSSDLYKNWIKGKQYTLLSIDSPITGGVNTDGLDTNGQVIPIDETATPPHTNIVNYEPGQIGSYDDHDKTAPKFSLPLPSSPDKVSNLEAEFAFRLIDAFPSNW